MKRTLLAIDIRNTLTRFAVACNGTIIARWSIATNTAFTPNEAVWLIHSFLENAAQGLPCVDFEQDIRDLTLEELTPDDAIISCVSPSLTEIWVEAAQLLCGRRPLTVGPGLKTGLQINYSDPSAIGTDRVAEMVAAKNTYGTPTLVIDLGISTTFGLLDQSGAFKGGLIAPGMRLAGEALARKAARLPAVEVKATRTLIARSTHEAIQGGMFWGEVARIDGLIDMIWREAGYETSLVISGRDAEAVASCLSHKAAVDQTLALRGLVAIYELNRK